MTRSSNVLQPWLVPTMLLAATTAFSPCKAASAADTSAAATVTGTPLVPSTTTTPPPPATDPVLNHVFQGEHGWHMISAPAGVSQSFSSTGLTAYAFDSSTHQYAGSPTPPADTFHPGQAYWVFLTQPVTVSGTGAPADPSQPFTIPLQAGWNMVGNPFPAGVSLANVSVIDGAAASTPFTTALSGNVVSPLYVYDSGIRQYATLATAGQILEPWAGAWIFAAHPVSLVVQAPGGLPVPPNNPPALPGGGQGSGSQNGHQDGSGNGSQNGHQDGSGSGSQNGHQDGSGNGSQNGHQDGHQDGSGSGSQNGHQDGSGNGSQTGHQDGSGNGSQTGHTQGDDTESDANEVDANDTTGQ